MAEERESEGRASRSGHLAAGSGQRAAGSGGGGRVRPGSSQAALQCSPEAAGKTRGPVPGIPLAASGVRRVPSSSFSVRHCSALPAFPWWCFPFVALRSTDWNGRNSGISTKKLRSRAADRRSVPRSRTDDSPPGSLVERSTWPSRRQARISVTCFPAQPCHASGPGGPAPGRCCRRAADRQRHAIASPVHRQFARGGMNLRPPD